VGRKEPVSASYDGVRTDKVMKECMDLVIRFELAKERMKQIP